VREALGAETRESLLDAAQRVAKERDDLKHLKELSDLDRISEVRETLEAIYGETTLTAALRIIHERDYAKTEIAWGRTHLGICGGETFHDVVSRVVKERDKAQDRADKAEETLRVCSPLQHPWSNASVIMVLTAERDQARKERVDFDLALDEIWDEVNLRSDTPHLRPDPHGVATWCISEFNSLQAKNAALLDKIKSAQKQTDVMQGEDLRAERDQLLHLLHDRGAFDYRLRTVLGARATEDLMPAAERIKKEHGEACHRADASESEIAMRCDRLGKRDGESFMDVVNRVIAEREQLANELDDLVGRGPPPDEMPVSRSDSEASTVASIMAEREHWAKCGEATAQAFAVATTAWLDLSRQLGEANAHEGRLELAQAQLCEGLDMLKAKLRCVEAERDKLIRAEQEGAPT